MHAIISVQLCVGGIFGCRDVHVYYYLRMNFHVYCHRILELHILLLIYVSIGNYNSDIFVVTFKNYLF